MSAWLVAQGHIDVLVQGLIEYRLIEPDKGTETGRLLWLENRRSLLARYREPVNDEANETYVFTGVESLPCLIQATGCFIYQSCEHDEWEASLANGLMQALEAWVAERVMLTVEEAHAWTMTVAAKRERQRGAYPGIPWGFVSVHQATPAGVEEHLRRVP